MKSANILQFIISHGASFVVKSAQILRLGVTTTNISLRIYESSSQVLQRSVKCHSLCARLPADVTRKDGEPNVEMLHRITVTLL
jgi:hypothetical protein